MEQSIAPSKPAVYLYKFGLFGFAFFSAFSISGSQISLGLALIGLAWRWFSDRSSLPFPPFLHAYAFFVLAGILSLTNAQDLGRGVAELKKYLIIIVFLIPFWGQYESTICRKILGLMLLSASIAGLYGVALTVSRLMFNLHVESLRASGFYSMPLTFGECQALYLLLALAWLVNEGDRSVRKLLTLAGIALFGGMLASCTRGAFLGFAIGVVVLYWRQWKKLAATLVILSVCVVAAGHVVRPNSDPFKINSTNQGSIGGNPRWGMWKHGLLFWQSAPLFGVGLNNIKPIYKAWLEQNPDYPHRHLYGHLHNNFMQFLVMTGLFGLIAFVWLLASIGRFCYIQEQRRQCQTVLAPGTSLALWCAFIGFGFTEYSFGDEEVAMLAFFLIGLLHAHTTAQVSSDVPPCTSLTR